VEKINNYTFNTILFYLRRKIRIMSRFILSFKMPKQNGGSGSSSGDGTEDTRVPVIFIPDDYSPGGLFGDDISVRYLLYDVNYENFQLTWTGKDPENPGIATSRTMRWNVPDNSYIGTTVPKTKIATIKVTGQNDDGLYTYSGPEVAITSPIEGLEITYEASENAPLGNPLTTATVFEYTLYISGTIGECHDDPYGRPEDGSTGTWETGVISFYFDDANDPYGGWGCQEGVTVDITVNNYCNYDWAWSPE
jgi:hypothetical protein